MKIILFSIGSRGDIEPFLAVGELLKGEGHQVICSFPEQFRSLADDSGLDFSPLSKDFIELIEGDDAKLAMGGKVSLVKKVGAYIRLYRKSEGVNQELVLQEKELVERERPDRIIYGAKAIYPLVWGMIHPGRSIFLSPVPCLTLYTREHPHVGFKGRHGPLFNRFTYILANFGLIRHVVSTMKRAGIRVKGSEIRNELYTRKMIYLVSSTIFPRPDYWPSNATVLGYHERNSRDDWTPGTELLDFLNTHEKVLFITFGSMTNPEPEQTTSVILESLQKHRIPAIINTASGGLTEPETYDHELIRFVDRIPYHWILPRVYGVVHHGGSGTTQLALKHGCASLVIPHVIDQFMWNTFVDDSGAGPSGVPMRKLTEERFGAKLLDLYQNESYKTKALELSDTMNREDREAELLEAITG
jgi:sterol 3beta-glucosyltransferase